MSIILPWHQQAWQRLLEQADSGRLPHALLLTGPQGSGRHQFVEHLSAWLVCEDRHNRPCGHCRGCLLFQSGNHPDVLMVEPEEGSQSIKIDQIRRLGQWVNQTANQAGATKLIVIRPAEGLGVAAANSLLKNLEEPPGATLFVLVAASGAALLPTIRSRCQLLSLPAADQAQAMEWLREHNAAQEAELKSALVLVPGRPVAALALLEQGLPAWREMVSGQLTDLLEGRITVPELAKLASAQPTQHAIKLIDDWLAERCHQLLTKQQMQALRISLDYRRELIKLAAQLNSSANPNELMMLEALFAGYKRMMQDAHNTLVAGADANPSARSAALGLL
jgi:DNA polymerase III subunit delta'